MLLRPLIAALSCSVLLGLAGCAPSEQLATVTAQPMSTEELPAPIMDAGLGSADGYVAIGDTVSLDDEMPAILNLDPVLLDALERAAIDAADRDIRFSFTDAWRSEGYQQYLFEQAVLNYGGEDEARRWVKPADESHHVTGQAVDVATADAMDWLTRFGAAYGLCQIYANEAWHFEHVASVTDQCPEQLLDSSAG